MANDAWQSLPDLEGSDTLPMAGIDFFQLLRRLETETQVFGRGGGPAREPARLGQQIRQSFAVQDVASYVPASDTLPAKVRLMNLGLLGPEGPMPLHLTRWALDRLSQRWFSGNSEGATSDTTFVDFCDMMQHRFMALFYRAWADTRPEVQIQRKNGGRYVAMLSALGGADQTNKAKPTAANALRMQQAAALAHQVHGPERLTNFLSATVGAKIKLAEFIGNWVPIPTRLQSSIGGSHARLGTSSTIGKRTFQRQNKFELQVGPVDLSQFKEFTPGGAKLRVLKEALLSANGHEMDADIRLLLRKDQIPAATIGGCALSRSAWLAPKRLHDAGDLRIGHVVGRNPNLVSGAA